jgi:uncharacterized protein (TIGR00303 family)
MEMTGLCPLFINAGLVHAPTIPCLDVYGTPGQDPRFGDAVADASGLFRKGQSLGKFLGGISDLLVIGECVPGGTTTALCVLRGLGYDARVSSSYIENPLHMKEDVWRIVETRIKADGGTTPLDIVRIGGDPMIGLAAGMVSSYPGVAILAGGTQMLAVAAVTKALLGMVPKVATTCYVRDDPSANFQELAEAIGCSVYYVNPGFGDLGHSGLARYCIGEVKEGMGAGGAMLLAHLMGYSPDAIRGGILGAVQRCA